MVIALVRSGFLIFVSSPSTSGTITTTENFAIFGLGALVGLGAKDVVEKLINFLKEKLQVEESEKKDLMF